MKNKLLSPPWNLIEGRTLFHLETDSNHPDGAGIHICSLPKAREAEANFIYAAVKDRAELIKELQAALDSIEIPARLEGKVKGEYFKAGIRSAVQKLQSVLEATQ